MATPDTLYETLSITRARQGMVIVIPPGSEEDPTRNPTFYDPTFEYLKSIGFEII